MEIEQYSMAMVLHKTNNSSQIKKARACVIISPDEMNKNLASVIIAPTTSNTNEYPSRVRVNYDGNELMIVLDQIQTISKSRIIKIFPKLSDKEIILCKEVIKESFVD